MNQNTPNVVCEANENLSAFINRRLTLMPRDVLEENYVPVAESFRIPDSLSIGRQLYRVYIILALKEFR